jgi:hypothetical protein
MFRPVHTFSVMDLTRQRALDLKKLVGLAEERESE